MRLPCVRRYCGLIFPCDYGINDHKFNEDCRGVFVFLDDPNGGRYKPWQDGIGFDWEESYYGKL